MLVKSLLVSIVALPAAFAQVYEVETVTSTSTSVSYTTVTGTPPAKKVGQAKQAGAEVKIYTITNFPSQALLLAVNTTAIGTGGVAAPTGAITTGTGTYNVPSPSGNGSGTRAPSSTSAPGSAGRSSIQWSAMAALVGAGLALVL